MMKLPTGESCAGEPHARFGGRGGYTSRPLSMRPTLIFNQVRNIGDLKINRAWRDVWTLKLEYQVWVSLKMRRH